MPHGRNLGSLSVSHRAEIIGFVSGFPAGRPSERARAIASVTLIVVAAVLLLAGTLAFYVRSEIVDERAFADRAVAAVDDDEVSTVLGREIVVQLIDRGSTDLVAARPLLSSVVEAALRTEPFRDLVRIAARQANRALFVRGRDNVVFDLSDAAQVVAFGMRSVSPKLAREVPEDLDASLLALQRRAFATQSLELADDVRFLGLVLPPLALLVFVAAIAVAPDRRVGVLRSVAIGAAAVLLAVAVVLVRAGILAGVTGADELTDAEAAAAVGGVFDAFFGDLFSWALALALFGLVIAGAATALDPEHVDAPAARLRRLLGRPRTTAGRALRGCAALALGVFVVMSPALAVEIAAILGGAYLVFFGMSELLVLLQGPAQTRHEGRQRRRRALTTAGIAGLAAVGGAAALIVIAIGGQEGTPASAATAPARTCNGSAALCELRLNEAVFAGTHNAFSAADSPGWFIANQRRTIDRQLRDGIRLFLIDTHWGVEDDRGRVRTDFDAEGRSRNRVAAALPPGELQAVQRLAGRLGVSGEGGERDLWLCHTVCELGATRLADTLGGLRQFLDDNRGEVVILFVEPYVPAREFAKAAEQAGLDRYVATLARDEPLPTLGELVGSNQRLVVFAEQDADGSVPWYLDGFSFIQDTPLGATNREQLSCARNRGTADSPLLMLNHWADVFPPSLEANGPFQQKRFILDRAHRCARRRGLPVNLIAVDHYDHGDLIAAVDELNAEQVRAVRGEQAALSE